MYRTYIRQAVVSILVVPVCLMLLAQTTSAQKVSRYALIVGVKEYTECPDQLAKLPFAEKDAEALHKTFKDLGYSITLLTQSQKSAYLKPSGSRVRKNLEMLCETPGLNKNDCVVIVLSGHGIQLRSKEKEDDHRYYFCTSNSNITDVRFHEDVKPHHNLILINDIYAELGKCKAGLKLLILDSCRNDPTSGNAFRAATSTRPAVPPPPGGMVTLFSCSAQQKAVETAELGHGVFTYYLMEGLQGNADMDQDREITLLEVYAYAQKRTYDYVRLKYHRQQRPELHGKLIGGGVIAKLTKPVPPPIPMPPKPTPTPPKPTPTPPTPTPPKPTPTPPKPTPTPEEPGSVQTAQRPEAPVDRAGQEPGD